MAVSRYSIVLGLLVILGIFWSAVSSRFSLLGMAS